MPKKCSTAVAAIRILEELKKTDRNHPITQTQLAEKLGCERKTIARILTIMEVEMNFVPGRIPGYGIYYQKSETDFTPYEVRLLADAVLSCKSINAPDARILVKKLTALLSERDGRHIPRVPISGNNDLLCNDFFLNIDMLSEAMERRKQVDFIYQGNIVRLTPLRLTFLRAYYVLLGKCDSGGPLSVFRLEKMENIRILEDTPSELVDVSMVNVPDLELPV